MFALFSDQAFGGPHLSAAGLPPAEGTEETHQLPAMSPHQWGQATNIKSYQRAGFARWIYFQ